MHAFLFLAALAAPHLAAQELSIAAITCGSNEPCAEVRPGDKVTVITSKAAEEDLTVILYVDDQPVAAPRASLKKGTKEAAFTIEENAAGWVSYFEKPAARKLSIGRTEAGAKAFAGGQTVQFRPADPPGVTAYSIRNWTVVKERDKIDCAAEVAKSKDDGKAPPELCWARLGDRIELELAAGALSRFKPSDEIVMWIDGRPMPGVTASRLGPSGGNRLVFDWDQDLPSREGSKESWMRILRNPRQKASFEVSAGALAGPPLPTSVKDLRIRRISQRALVAWAVFFGLALIGMFVLSRRTDILREDRGAGDVSGNERRAYSLAKTQMAAWTFVVAMAFTYVWTVTWNEDVLNARVLVLMGIAIGTTLGAGMVDSSKREAANRTLAGGPVASPPPVATGGGAAAAPAPMPNPAIEDARSVLATPRNEWFLMDLVSDRDGPSVARVQMVLFTLILMVIFIIETAKTLVMPQFSDTLLGLMGLSSSGYLAFKVPERKV